MPYYVECTAFHACDTCGAPCCGKGWYPMAEDELDDYDRAEGLTVEHRRATFQHHLCLHTNRSCSCGGTLAPSERLGDLTADVDSGWC